MASSAREEQCVVLCARIEVGVSANEGYAIRDTLNGLDTGGWWFLNPGTFLVVFVSANAGAERAAACELALRRLAIVHSSLAGMGVGIIEGPVIGQFSSVGILETWPMGSVVSNAMRSAVENAG